MGGDASSSRGAGDAFEEANEETEVDPVDEPKRLQLAIYDVEAE